MDKVRTESCVAEVEGYYRPTEHRDTVLVNRRHAITANLLINVSLLTLGLIMSANTAMIAKFMWSLIRSLWKGKPRYGTTMT